MKFQEQREQRLRDTRFARLFDTYRTELLRFAAKKVGDGPPEPADLVQQAFANFAKYEERGQVERPRAFLYRTIQNLITDHHRNVANMSTISLGETNLDEVREDVDELSPEIVLLDRERFSEVLVAVKSLPQRQRRFLLLNRLEGMSYTEIARRNGVSISTARREVEAAADACRAAIEHLMSDDDQ